MHCVPVGGPSWTAASSCGGTPPSALDLLSTEPQLASPSAIHSAPMPRSHDRMSARLAGCRIDDRCNCRAFSGGMEVCGSPPAVAAENGVQVHRGILW